MWRWLGPRVASAPRDTVIYAVGDVHGCDALLSRMLSDIVADAETLAGTPDGAGLSRRVLVFLGDYVDRGPSSRKVIDRLMRELPTGFEARFLKGNHEDAMLQFLSGDTDMGPRWREFGGLDTLASYGVDLQRGPSNAIDWDATRFLFEQNVPAEHRAFLENLESMAVLGDYVFVHAGVRPGVLLRDQREHDVMWIRDDFLYDDGPLEKVVVHGHTAQNAPFWSDRRIGVDTGAYSSGVLTSVRLFGETVEFLQTQSS
ncbi:MAG: serine/threonine protein phosphatase [Caulobacterales bacterium]|nr:serine/threonine protein phosphatase [Caulobacterales bacterium]